MKVGLAVIAGVVALATTAGCKSKYVVHVNGFLNQDRAEQVQPGACIAVAKNEAVVNALLESETRRRIEKLLLARGYTICSREKADYELRFRYNMDGGRTILRDRVVHEPGHTVRVLTHEGGADSYSSYYVPGSTRWVTDAETVYGCWLMLELYDARGDGGESADDKPLWVGEMAASSRAPDLREMVGPMLLSGFEYFGRDTGKRVTIVVPRSDPGLLELLGE